MEAEPSTSRMSPVFKNVSGKMITSGQKMIIVNLYKNLKVTQPNMLYKDLVASLCRMSGIGKVTIQRTIAEYTKTKTISQEKSPQQKPNKKKARPGNLKKLKEEEKILIRKKVHHFWIRKEIPTIKNVLEAVNKDTALPHFAESTLYEVLKELNFKYAFQNKNSPLIDKSSIVAWRQQYINTIRRYRQANRPIYFLGETWINANNYKKLQNGKIASTPEQSGMEQKLIAVHIGSIDGFLPDGLKYFEPKLNSDNQQEEIDADAFFEWFCKIEPMLKQNAIIIMNNAPHHSKIAEAQPTSNWSRQQLQEWLILQGHNVPDWFVKRTLIQMINEMQVKDKYIIDEYAKDHGKVVLRLPPYHCEFNPIELAWHLVKGYIKQNITEHNLTTVKSLFEKGIEKVTPNKWKNFMQLVINIEEQFKTIDHFAQSILDDSNNEQKEGSTTDTDSSDQ